MSGQVLQDYLIKQDAAVVSSFLDDTWDVCAVTNYDELRPLTGRNNVTVVSLASFQPTEATVVHHNGFPELWVRARRSDYAGPFFAFVKQEYSISWSRVPTGYNVDHLFSKKRAGLNDADAEQGNKLPPLSMVRMLLVAAPVNQSFGGLMENDYIGSGNRGRQWRKFSWLQLAKALSIDANLHGGGFGGPNLNANLWHIVDEFEKRGILKQFGLGREQMMGHLQSMVEYVLHLRKLKNAP